MTADRCCHYELPTANSKARVYTPLNKSNRKNSVQELRGDSTRKRAQLRKKGDDNPRAAVSKPWNDTRAMIERAVAEALNSALQISKDSSFNDSVTDEEEWMDRPLTSDKMIENYDIDATSMNDIISANQMLHDEENLHRSKIDAITHRIDLESLVTKSHGRLEKDTMAMEYYRRKVCIQWTQDQIQKQKQYLDDMQKRLIKRERLLDEAFNKFAATRTKS